MMDEKLEQETVEFTVSSPSVEEYVPPTVNPKTWAVVFVSGNLKSVASSGVANLSADSFDELRTFFRPIPVFAAIQSELAASFGTPNQYIWFIPSWLLIITVYSIIA
jgi:hypothetical protein